MNLGNLVELIDVYSLVDVLSRVLLDAVVQ